MDSVGNAILFTMNWNPAYSYSTLPAGYNPDSIPPHWKTMLHKVDPPEKGIPHFKDIYVSGITVASARKAILRHGLDQSYITGVHIDDVTINAATAGDITFGKDWQLSKFAVTTNDGSIIQVKNSYCYKPRPMKKLALLAFPPALPLCPTADGMAWTRCHRHPRRQTYFCKLASAGHRSARHRLPMSTASPMEILFVSTKSRF